MILAAASWQKLKQLPFAAGSWQGKATSLRMERTAPSSETERHCWGRNLRKQWICTARNSSC